MNFLSTIFILLAILLTSCSNVIQPIRSGKANTDYQSEISNLLRSLPPPNEPIIVAIYKYRDQTGQYKTSDNSTSYSTAVTQGATSMLIRA